MSKIYDVAIAGGGFAGLMVAANLALRDGPENQRPRPALYWTDAGGKPDADDHRFGTAYATAEDHHLLNVRADGMSAWLGGGADFLRWLEPHYPGHYAPESFVPRRLYGMYLASIKRKVRAALGDHLTTDAAALESAAQHDGVWTLGAADGSAVRARHLVLATGNPALRPLSWPENDPRFVHDAWAWRLAGGRAPEAAPIVIAGTGLTAVDIVLSLRADGYAGPITAVSPHGRWPHPHAAAGAYDRSRALIAGMMGRRSARGYLRLVREHAARAGDWRAVIAGLRDHTAMLWQALPLAEKQRFMRHLWSLWNIHRHRMPPESHAQLAGDAALVTVAGRVRAGADGAVEIAGRDGTVRRLPGAAAINCTGPDYRQINANPLIASLLSGGYLAAGPLGLGIASPAVPGLYAVGTMLVGEQLETTAVPDLRRQAAAVATRIAASL